ncbi:hypothetical protein SAMN05216352_10513 [Alteribacillus bidgolensis]|uniref:Uncharacterized protein n=1 Tax=Alteribacillus bidgolensis TaxID=930129 RepID=A0A1G8I2I8_9BACI|nr:hypothetical protein SAMN05216352_10513 [Alteribacillus bidgolensis]
MAKELVNYQSSVPTNFNDSISRSVSETPISVALFGMTTFTSNTNVVLFGSVGLRSTLGTPEVLFKVIRDTAVIGSTLSSPIAAGEFFNVPISFVDLNVPPGFHRYTLTAELTTSSVTTNADIVGPVTFTGLAITT